MEKPHKQPHEPQERPVKKGFQPKISPEERQEIISLYSKGNVSQAALAERFGVTQGAVSAILHKSKMKEKQNRLKAEDLPNLDYSLVYGTDPSLQRKIPVRPTREISHQVFRDILLRIADGTPLQQACYLEKVAPGTFRGLINKYPDLAQQVQEARAEYLETLRKQTMSAASENPAVLLKFLERLEPEVYAPPAQTVHTTSTNTVNHTHTHQIAILDAPEAPPARIARPVLVAIARGESVPVGGTERALPADVVEAEVVSVEENPEEEQ